jgi:hypothetical protein
VTVQTGTSVEVALEDGGGDGWVPISAPGDLLHLMGHSAPHMNLGGSPDVSDWFTVRLAHEACNVRPYLCLATQTPRAPVMLCETRIPSPPCANTELQEIMRVMGLKKRVGSVAPPSCALVSDRLTSRMPGNSIGPKCCGPAEPAPSS